MGGVHQSENKLSCAKPIEVLPLPDVVTIPLAQHIGAPAVAKVAKGDRVLTGQLIAEAGSFMSANIHSPISGTVTAVDMVVNGQGLRQMMITIKREGDDWAEGIDRSETIVRECTLSAQEIVARIKDAGIVGMGGATFPTHVKLSIPPGKKAESLIINGVECEPYLTSDHRTMLEHGEELLVGVTILMKAIAVEKAYIGIENNKPDAIAHLRRLAQGYKGIEVVPLKVKYPQGGEKQLCQAITGKQVPPGGLPANIGCAVFNINTTIAIYHAIKDGMPVVRKVVTVSGSGVVEPKNLECPIGTPVSLLFDACGGLKDETYKLIMGGPMMGLAQYDVDVSVGKGTGAMLAFADKEEQYVEDPQCIRCGKCVGVCPIRLEPIFMYKYLMKGDVDTWQNVLHGMDCIECGACTYTCPARLPLTHAFRLGKQEVNNARMAAKAKAEAEAKAAAEKKEA